MLAPIRPLVPAWRRGSAAAWLLVLIVLNRPRVDLLWRSSVPPLLACGAEDVPDPAAPVDAGDVAAARSGRVADGGTSGGSTRPRRSPGGWASGQDAVQAAFGRLDMPELPEVYDAIGLLDLPERGRPVDPDLVRRALGPYLFKEPEPRPRLAPARRAMAAAGREPDWNDRGSRRGGLNRVRLIGSAQNGLPSSIGSAMVARFSNRVRFLRKVSLTVPVGAVAVLGDDDLGDAGLVVGVVVLGPVEQEDHVGVLLDGARLAEVGHPRAAVLAVLDGPVELREGDHRDVQLAGQRLEPAADLGDLLLAAVARVLGVDELDVVDHDQAEVLPQLEPAGHGRDLEHVPRGGVVDEDRGARRSSSIRLAQLVQLAVVEALAGPQLVAVDPRPGAEQPLGRARGGPSRG